MVDWFREVKRLVNTTSKEVRKLLLVENFFAIVSVVLHFTVLQKKLILHLQSDQNN